MSLEILASRISSVRTRNFLTSPFVVVVAVVSPVVVVAAVVVVVAAVVSAVVVAAVVVSPVVVAPVVVVVAIKPFEIEIFSPDKIRSASASINVLKNLSVLSIFSFNHSVLLNTF